MNQACGRSLMSSLLTSFLDSLVYQKLSFLPDTKGCDQELPCLSDLSLSRLAASFWDTA